MFIAYAVAAAASALVLAVSAIGKLTHHPRIDHSLTHLGVPAQWYPWLAAAETAGALGLLAGLVIPMLGIAAATGLTLYFLGAVIAHLRSNDLQGLASPTLMLAITLAALTLRAVEL